MRVREIIDELIQKKFGTQTALAKACNPMPAGIKPAKPEDIQRLASAGRNQEKQFAIFLKLLPLCRELGIDPHSETASSLHVNAREEGRNNVREVQRDIIQKVGKAKKVQAGQTSTRDASGVPSRQLRGSKP